MKKIFTLIAMMMAVMSANADNVTTDLELVGSGVVLPPKYITGRAEFQNFRKWGEVMLFDKEQSDGKYGSAYEIYTDEWPILHVEFEQIQPTIQFKFQSNGTDKYLSYDDKTQLVYDIDLRERGFEEGAAITLLAIQSNDNLDDPVIIKECYLTTDDGSDKMYLYYAVNNASGWGAKIVGDAKLLSGKVVFNEDTWAQMGGADWAPADLLKEATNAIWTIELFDPVPEAVTLAIDADRTYYLSDYIQPGATVITYNVTEYHGESSYSPELPAQITNWRIQVPNKLDHTITLNIKSVKLTVEGVAGGDTNGVKAVSRVADADAPVFNISGQRVSSPAKGLYIKNGRKFIVK